jgi:uncharacterized protein YigE (DUF2233 family)
MSMSSLLKAFLTALGIVLGSAALSAESESPLACAPQAFEEVSYVVCSIDLKLARPRLFWKGADGQPYRTFANLAKAVADEGKSLTFAMNAGMYADDFSPMGLYVEDGDEQRPANTVKLKPSTNPVPNFYKKPNGVFFIDDTGAGILPTEIFLKRKQKTDFATQSGPMLVIENKLNPIFIMGSTDRKRRTSTISPGCSATNSNAPTPCSSTAAAAQASMSAPWTGRTGRGMADTGRLSGWWNERSGQKPGPV